MLFHDDQPAQEISEMKMQCGLPRTQKPPKQIKLPQFRCILRTVPSLKPHFVSWYQWSPISAGTHLRFLWFFCFCLFFLELCILCQISKSTNVLNLLWTYLWTSILFHLQNNYAMICLYIFFWWKRKMLSLLLVRHSKVIKEIYSILFTDWNQRYD